MAVLITVMAAIYLVVCPRHHATPLEGQSDILGTRLFVTAEYLGASRNWSSDWSYEETL